MAHNYFIFLILSAIESAAILTLGFKLYRFHHLYKYHTTQIIISAILLSYMSLTFRMYHNWDAIDPLIQLILTIVCIWQLFRVHLFYSALIGVSGFIGNVLLQSIIFFVLRFTGILTLKDVSSSTSLGTYVIQIVAIIFTFLIAWFIMRKNYGFSFVPTDNGVGIKFTKLNTFLLLLILTAIVLTITFFGWFTYGKTYSDLSVAVVFGLILSLLVYISIKKEDAEW